MRKFILGAAALLLLFAGCGQEKAEPEPVEAEGPKMVASEPADGVADLTGASLTVTVTFDQNVKCPLDQRDRIAVDGGAVVENINAYNEKVTISISGLEENTGKEYTLVLPEGTVLGFKANQRPASEIRLSFTMKHVGPYVPSVLDPVKSLTNPNATASARNLYNFLLEQSGKKMLSGVQSSSSSTNDMVDLVYEKTGKYPALAGYDFIFLHFSPTPGNWSWKQDYTDITDRKEHWDNNGVVSYTWHWNVPNSKQDWDNGVNDYNFDGYDFYTDRTTFDINEALKEGTWQNDFIMKDIEEVAGYLKKLQDAGIPVLWRPLHEAAGNYDLYGPNGAWFWWGRGGAEPCKALWKLLYDRLVNVYGLNNLIWVWTVDVTKGCEDQYLDWYPGDEYVDIVGVDIYEDNTGAKERQHQALIDLTKGTKLVTVSECGNIPDPEKSFEAGHKWSWFMVWSSTDASGNPSLYSDGWQLNTEAYWSEVMSSPYVLTREAMPDLK